MTDDERRAALQAFAVTEFQRSNNCRILISIVIKAVALVEGQRSPARKLIEDLEAVMVGGLWARYHSQSAGPYFAGYKVGSYGLRKEFQDVPYTDQISHAVGGLVLGFRYSLPGWLGAVFLEWTTSPVNWADIYLFNATCPIGMWLNDHNYKELPAKLQSAIGAPSCFGDPAFDDPASS